MAAALLISLFRHKSWADEELIAEVARIDPVAHEAEHRLAIRLLNHIHVVDRIFEAHLSGRSHSYAATNTETTPTLEALRADVLACDRWYLDHVGSLDAGALSQHLTFTFTDGAPGLMTREEVLAHVATHGSYHRGAVGRLLVQASLVPPRDTLTVYLHRCEPERRSMLLGIDNSREQPPWRAPASAAHKA